MESKFFDEIPQKLVRRDNLFSPGAKYFINEQIYSF